MSEFIAKKIIKKQSPDKQTDARLRNLIGVVASFVGIIANLLIGTARSEERRVGKEMVWITFQIRHPLL